MKLKQFIFAFTAMLSCFAVSVNAQVAKVGGTEYTTLADALDAAKAKTGDVTVELYEKVTLNQPLNGSFTTITFVGKDTDAEIYLDVQGYITATNKKVAFKNLTLSKSQGGFIANAGFMNVAFGVYDVAEVTYTNCTFANGAYASSGKVTYDGCTFKKSWDKYGLWAYGNVDVTVQGSTFADYRGIKMYAENGADASVEKANLTVKNTNFSAVDNKPAIVLTYGESVVLEGNTYSSTGTFELDLDGKPNGVAVTSDVAPTCVNDNGACGVLVDGKIYTTVAQAAEVATAGSTVTLLHNSTETVKFPEGVTLNKNGFTANGVTVVAVAKIGDVEFATLQAALDAAAAGTGNVTVTILADVDLTGVDWNPVTVSAPGYPVVTVEGNNKTITGLNDMLFAGTWAGKSGLIIKNLTIANSAIVNDKDDAKGTVGVGAFIGYPQASATITLENCHLKNSSVEGGHWTGGLIGMAGGYNGADGPVFMNLTIKGCSVTGSTITGKGSVGGVIGHGSCAAWTNVVIEETTVSSNSITSTGSSNVKAGAVMGTIGAAGQPTTVNGVTHTGGMSVSATVEANTVESNGTEITTIYGRQGTETGMLYIAGGSYDKYPIEEGVAYAAPAKGYKIVENNGTYGIVEDPEYGKVAKVGDACFETLAQAVAAVEDGGTITLIANETFTKNNRTHNTGTWYDGLYYVGDKSFTIDLGGFTIGQDGSVNDYLLNFKNSGSKANTITLKNGTVDAGTKAFCALCTSSSQENQLTINTENLALINNISNGSTVKLRGGAILNVKEGTVITGKNSYLGIECVASTVNIYDGAKIYMNGTSSYNGCLVGACAAGTVNVYGGYGKGVKGGFIAMTSGGTINIEGGEWIANTDGTVGNNSNLYVLTAQSNKKESGFAGPSIINVTGGTFRGGMDAWVLNNVEGEKAELNIKGGNFNANPTSYVADGYLTVENNGVWNVVKAAAKIDKQGYATVDAAIKAAKAGDTVTILAGTYPVPAMKAGITVVGEGEVLLEGTLSGNLENLTLKNLHIKGGNAQRWAYGKGNLVFENVTFEATSVYALHFDGIAEGTKLTYKDCTIIGWAAMGGKPESCIFDGCTIKGNGTYGVIRTYFDTTIKGCTFDVANVSTTDTYEDGIHAVEGAKVVVKNCTNANGDMKDIVNVHGTSVVTVDGEEIKNAAKIGDKYYATLEEAFKAAKAGDTVTILAGTYPVPAMKAGITVVGEGEVLLEGTLSGNLENLTLKNLHIKGGNAQRWAYGKGNLVFENVTFEATSVYALHFDGIAEGTKLTYKDCTIIGWAAMGGKPESCIFDGCTIKGNGTYGVIRTYFDTTIKGCTFDVANVSTTDAYEDGIHAVDGAEVVVNDCINANGDMKDIVNVHGASVVTVDGVEIKNAAKIGDKYYATLEEAFKAAKTGETVTIFEGTYNVPAMKAGITVVGEGEVLLEGTLSGTLENLTLKNLHIKGGNAQRWAYGKGNLVFENVTFEATSVYALHFDGITAGTNLTYKNCTIIGWAAMGGSPASCVFDGCTIKGNGTYGVIRTYFDTTIKDCTFNVANVSTTDTYEDGIHAVEGAKVVVNNCTNENGEMKDIVNVHGTSVVTIDGKEIKNAAKAGNKYYTTFDDAFAAVQAGETLTLLADLSMSKILVLDKAITFDGNGKKLTSSAGRAINVSGADGVTIKNLTIDAKGERAINVIQNATNVTIDNVTATAANYTVNVATSAPNAVVAIKNSTLNGLCTVNVSAAGAQVTVDNSTVNCNDNNTTAGESYAALSLNKEAVGGSIVATNSTINVTDGSDSVKGRNGAEDGTVTINGSTEGVAVMVAAITYTNSDNYHAFATLKAAIEFAKTGDVVTLIRNVEASEVILLSKSVTINGEGHKVTSSATRVFRVTTSNTEVTLNDVNMVSTAVRVGTNDVRGISIDIVDNVKLTLNNCSVDFTDASANDWAYAVNVTGGNKHVVTIIGGAYEGANVINVRGANNAVTIKDATLTSTYPNSDNINHYGACIWVLQNQGSTVVAEGNTFNGNNAVAFNLGTGTELTASNNTDNTKLFIIGQGTEDKPYLIKTAGQLVDFRNSVNAGETTYNAPDVWVALGADIDLAGENWVGIGSATADHGFMGNFDGKNFKIMNLTITNPALDSDGYAYAGLFGVTEGKDKDNQNTIKNLTIENVTITTTGHIAAAAVAYPYYTIIDNVKVCGNIAIEGGDYTAGVLAYTRRCVNASNLTISGNQGSYVKGNITVGGVISDIQMNGGLTADYKNFRADRVTVSGTMNVGGISGIISGQALDGATVKNVTLNSSDARTGIVAGALGIASTITNVTYENVTGAATLIGGGYDSAKAVQAKIGDTYYATLRKAVEAAKSGETVKLLKDVTLEGGYDDAEEGLRIEKAINIVGGGHTIDCANFKKGIRVYNNGTTVNKVQFTAVTIVNNVVNGRCIDTRSANIHLHLLQANLIATNGNSQPLTIGGNDATNKVEMYGTEINAGNSGYGVICFVPVTNGISASSSNINGLAAFYIKHDASEFTLNIGSETYTGSNMHSAESGFFGTVVVEGKDNKINVVSNGAIIKAVAGNDATQASQAAFLIRGAGNTINFQNSAAQIVTEGANAYEVAVKSDIAASTKLIKGGKEQTLVAETKGYQFYSLEEAVRFAGNNGTTKVVSDIELAQTLTIAADDTKTLDLNGKTISSNITEQLTKSFAAIQNKGTLTVKDASADATGKISVSYAGNTFGYGMGLYTISNEGGVLNIEGGTIENLCTVSGSMYDAIDNNSTLGETVLNISGGSVVCKKYIGIRQFANSTTANNVVNISGGNIKGGNTSIWMQNPNSKANKATLTITGADYEKENYPIIEGRLLAGESAGFVFDVKGGLFDTDVNDFCAPDYASYDFGNGTWGVESTNIESLDIVDGAIAEFVNQNEKTVGTLTYTRTFQERMLGKWQSLYVPFEIPVSELTDRGYEVAYFNNFHEPVTFDGEPTGNNSSIELIKIKKDGAILKANYPYVIKPTTDASLNMSLVLKDVKLYSTTGEREAVECSNATKRFTFNGIYKKGTKFDFTGNAETPVYAITPDGKMQEMSETATVGVFRVYMAITTKKGEPYIQTPGQAALAREIPLRVIGEEDENGATIIYDVVEDSQNNNGDDFIYDLQGRRVSEPKKGGIYIKNGKKILY